MKENISEHITYAEAIHSNTAVAKGISNDPNEEQLKNMKLVAQKCFEPLRVWYGKAIGLGSFFRGEKLNAVVPGSSNTSDHTKGKAIDINAHLLNNGITNKQIFDWLVANIEEWDQIIWEKGTDKEPAWVHISYRAEGNRKQVLRCIEVQGKPKYVPYEH